MNRWLLGVAQVHPQELGGEQRGLLAAGAGPDLEDHVAIVVRVARQQQDLEVLDAAASSSASSRAISSRAIARISVVAVARVAQLAGAGELRRGSPRGGGTPRRRARGGRAPGRAGGSRPGRCVTSGLAELGLELVVLVGDLGQLGVELGRRAASPAHAPGSGAIGRPVGCGRPALRPPSPGSSIGVALEQRSEPAGTRLAVGLERLLHRDDRDLDHVVGRALRRDHLDEDARDT